MLAAARELFTERGYDRTTVRDIAARAGANQALLFRYFGSKDALFRAVLTGLTLDVLTETPAEELPARLLTHLLIPDDQAGLGNWLQAALRSSGHDESVSVIRELGEEYLGALSPLTDAADAALRSDLVVAWLLGIALLRSVYSREPLASADPAAVARHVLCGVRMLLERTDVRFPAS